MLHAAALAHLARFAATEAGLRRVLERRITRWAHAAEAARDATAGGEVGEIAAGVAEARRQAAAIAARLAASGVVDDATFAAARTRRLARARRARRAIAAHLAAKGVDAETARAALAAGEDGDLLAALALARRRRLGPFAPADARPADTPDDTSSDDEAAARRPLAILARAGFPREIAERVLAMAPEQAEALLLRARQG